MTAISNRFSSASRFGFRFRVAGALSSLLLTFAFGCSSGSGTPSASATTCPTLTGDPWVPAVPGTGAVNHDGSATVTKTVVASGVSGQVFGREDPVPTSGEILVTLDMSENLGNYGSFSLMASVDGFPSGYQGGAYAQLVSLVDSNNHDWIGLPRAGTGNDCAAAGYYSCTTSGSNVTCNPNPSCTPAPQSAYVDRNHWEQHALPSFGYDTVNTFPTCNWTNQGTGGNYPANLYPGCAFNQVPYFTSSTSGILPHGTYTAHYVLMSSDYASLAGVSATGNLTVTMVKKTRTATGVGGAVDLNVVLVGSQNIQDSRTAQGQLNLNLLVKAVNDFYNTTETNIRIGNVNAIEWPCNTTDGGGDAYATTDISNLGNLYLNGSATVPSSTEGSALNMLLVSSITDAALQQSGLSILGLSGAIGGPSVNGTSQSALAFSSFNKLGTYNANCSDITCAQINQDEGFIQMKTTIAHEMGHYLGLNHPSESPGTSHDIIYDTPICTSVDSSVNYIDKASCEADTHPYPTDTGYTAYNGHTCAQDCGGPTQFCPTARSCQFNYMMWWTGKAYDPETGVTDGSVFSTDQGILVNYHPEVQ